MKLKTLLLGGLILGVGLTSSIQLFASCHISEKYKPDIVYTVKSTAATSSFTFAEDEYKKLFYQVLKDFLGIDQSQLPSDAEFNIIVEDRKSIKESEAKALAAQKQSLKKKIITEADYNTFREQIENHENDTYDRIRCTLIPRSSELTSDTLTSDNMYAVDFNSETKEVLFVEVPLSTEGFNILAHETPVKISINDLESNCAELIRTHKIGGIQNPKCITNKIPGTNQKGGIPVLIYQDEKDATKKVTIAVDGSTGSINYIYVW